MKYTNKGKLFTDTVLEIFKASGHLTIEGDRLSKDLGLSSARWKVLGALKMSDHLLNVAQIARGMGLTRQAVQRLAHAMVKDGLLAYQHNPQHKRAHHVVLTEKGEQVYSAISEIQIPWANQMPEGISSADLETTLTVLKKVTALFDVE